MTIFPRLPLILLATTMFGCTADGHKRIEFTDASDNRLNGVLAIPLYTKSFGLSVGVDGTGPHTESARVITKPFLIDSGEDIMLKKVPTRGAILWPIPPASVADSNYVHGWLFLKAGFVPTLVSTVWKKGHIVMTPTDTDQTTPIVELLLSPAPDQSAIKKLYNAEYTKEPIAVEMDAEDIATIRKALR
jgi:hypothetical protein